MGLFSKIPGIDWDYTRLKDAIDALTGETIRRRAQHVIVFDPTTGEPLAFTSNGSGGVAVADPRLDRLAEIRDRLGGIFPSGSSSLITLPPLELSTSAKPLTTTPLLCRSVQIQSVRPDGSDNSDRIAIGTAERQTIYLSQLGTWGDTAPLGQELDLSQIYARGLIYGDFISIVVRV